MTDKPKKCDLSLTNAEALVLFDILSRFSDTDVLELRDRAESKVLWRICCLLEKQLAEPFDPNYRTLLQNAKTELSPVETEE